MDNKLILGLVASVLIGLMGFSLKSIYNMNGEIIKLQQGQIILSKQMEQNTLFIKKQMKRLVRKNKKKKQ